MLDPKDVNIWQKITMKWKYRLTCSGKPATLRHTFGYEDRDDNRQRDEYSSAHRVRRERRAKGKGPNSVMRWAEGIINVLFRVSGKVSHSVCDDQITVFHVAFSTAIATI
jgi:hypothetical protein